MDTTEPTTGTGDTFTPHPPVTTDAVQARRARIRVPIAEPPGLVGRLLRWYSRRTYGDVMDNALVLWHHKRALAATATYEKQVEAFDKLDPQLKALATTAVAARIGCSWCLDFGYYVAHTEGLDLAKVRDVPVWRESARFDSTERAVLEFAEAATATPPEVTDEMINRLTGILAVPAVVELVTMVALENQRSRFNSALGLSSQGFSDRCELPR